MARVAYDGMSVCEDCAALIVNGEGSDELVAAISELWGDLASGLILACDGEDDETCDSFSSRPCSGCGSRLAGSRHAAAVLVSDDHKSE